MTGQLIVVNKYKHTGPMVYIGRGSVFGNPFPVELGRDKCIAAFESYMLKLLQSATPLRRGMRQIAQRVLAGETVYLGCFCKPKACHGDVIKRFIDGEIEKYRAR